MVVWIPSIISLQPIDNKISNVSKIIRATSSADKCVRPIYTVAALPHPSPLFHDPRPRWVKQRTKDWWQRQFKNKKTHLGHLVVYTLRWTLTASTWINRHLLFSPFLHWLSMRCIILMSTLMTGHITVTLFEHQLGMPFWSVISPMTETSS